MSNRTRPTRALAVACVVAGVSLAGCSQGNGVRVTNFAAGGAGTFTFAAQTNTVMTANDDGAAERIRRDWLAEALTGRALCNTGYVVEDRRFLPVQDGVFGNGGDIVYTGHCL